MLAIEYRSDYHADLPHIVKLSGGRSSAYLAMRIAPQLNRERGDLMLFNNTSAEHPETYDFIRKLKAHIETAHTIPVLLIQYQSLKNKSGRRRASYRLVNDQPKTTANPNGYEWQGEVFEEMIAVTGYVPQVLNRSCTNRLKIQPSQDMLEDWTWHRPPSAEGDNTELSIEALYETHKRRRGKKTFERFVETRQYQYSRQGQRPAQRYEDYSRAYRCFDGGDNAVVSLIGLRGDEPHRIARIDKLRRPSHKDKVEEHVYCPLRDSTVHDVNDYWIKADFDLALPYENNVGNCAYCFLKGNKSIAAVLRWQYANGAKADTPADINWWKRIESTYGTPRKDGKGTVGFFRGNLNYNDLEDAVMKRTPDQLALWKDNMPCDCTD